MRYFISINPKNISTIIKVIQVVPAINCYKKAKASMYEMLGHKLIQSAEHMFVSTRDVNGLRQGIFLHHWPKKGMLNPELSFNVYLHTILKTGLYQKAKSKARYKVANHKHAVYRDRGNQGMYEDFKSYHGL